MGLWAMAWLMASGLWSQGEFPVRPYVDPSHLEVPWPKHSHKAGEPVLLATLKYLPAHPVGTQEFEEMAQGWVRYARLVCQAARRARLKEFDVEIWNELSFAWRCR